MGHRRHSFSHSLLIKKWLIHIEEVWKIIVYEIYKVYILSHSSKNNNKNQLFFLKDYLL